MKPAKGLAFKEESILNRETPEHPYFLTILRISLAFFLLLSSAAILYTTARNYQSAQSLADQSLESTALALSSSAEGALRAGGSKAEAEIREIFSDRVVAYALIADERGRILFHTNPRRVGSILSEEEKSPLWGSRITSGRRIILGTGLPAYEFSYSLHQADGGTEWLRLVLHTTPADRIVADARRMWWVGTAVLLLLWTVGVLRTDPDPIPSASGRTGGEEAAGPDRADDLRAGPRDPECPGVG
jgi:hypothetical protein